jgi:hypothetical protein
MSANSVELQQRGQTELHRASIFRRYGAYLHERFPLVANALLIVSFYSSNQFLAQAIDQAGHPVRYGLRSYLGVITLLGFFLHIRIFDDHKDFANDCRYYPNRVLQRGVVTLTHLKWLLAAVLLVECTTAAICGFAPWSAWVGALAFSLLMLREFYAGAWLRERFLLYATVHMLIIPVLTAVIWSFATGRFFWEAPPIYWLYSAASYLLAFNWEVSRKIRIPKDEIQGVDSYSERLGTYRAAWLAHALRIASTLLVAIVAYQLDLSLRFYGILVLILLVCSVGLAHHILFASTKTAKRLEIYAGVYILAFDLALATELGVRYGFEVGLAR